MGEEESSPNRSSGYRNHFAMKYRNTYCMLNNSKQKIDSRSNTVQSGRQVFGQRLLSSSYIRNNVQPNAN